MENTFLNIIKNFIPLVVIIWLFVKAYSGIIHRTITLPDISPEDNLYMNHSSIKKLNTLTGLRAVIYGIFFLFTGIVLFIGFYWKLLMSVFNIKL